MKTEPHHLAPFRGLPWRVCKKCGLVTLRNQLTDFALQHGCEWESHPKYEWARTTLVNRR